MDAILIKRTWRFGLLAKVLATSVFLASCGGSSDEQGAGGPTGNADPATRAEIEKVAQQVIKEHKLRSLIIRITKDGQDVYTSAMGESITGVPATPQMHIRNGAFAFTYIGQIFAKLADEGELTLDDKIATWWPELPRADQVSIKNLLNMTSGYADYVYQPELIAAVYADPFRAFTTDELVAIGVAVPAKFAPGTNWHYSHTNYAILGKLLEKITGMPLDEVMEKYIIKPMGLTDTSSNGNTPAVPEPVLHSFSSERRGYLEIPAGTPFYEDATFWNPSWTIANGAVQTTTIFDLTKSMEIVGSGAQVSREMYEEQVLPKLIGFGDPSTCDGCQHLTEDMSYGLGVMLTGGWISQTKNFAGSGVSSGYLPSRKLTISVSTTYKPEAFDDKGEFRNASGPILRSFIQVMAPDSVPRIIP